MKHAVWLSQPGKATGRATMPEKQEIPVCGCNVSPKQTFKPLIMDNLTMTTSKSFSNLMAVSARMYLT